MAKCGVFLSLFNRKECICKTSFAFAKPVAKPVLQKLQTKKKKKKKKKKLLGVKKSTQNYFIFGEIGRVSSQTSILYTAIKYWLKILETEQRRYIRYAYQLTLSDLEKRPNVSNLATKLKDLLSNLGFYHVWLNQGVAWFLRTVKERINDKLYPELEK